MQDVLAVLLAYYLAGLALAGGFILLVLAAASPMTDTSASTAFAGSTSPLHAE